MVAMARRCFSLATLWSLSNPAHFQFQLECSPYSPEHVSRLGLAALPITVLPPIITDHFGAIIAAMSIAWLPVLYSKYPSATFSYLDSILEFMPDHLLSKF